MDARVWRDFVCKQILEAETDQNLASLQVAILGELVAQLMEINGTLKSLKTSTVVKLTDVVPG